jgi:hypothetical protein
MAYSLKLCCGVNVAWEAVMALVKCAARALFLSMFGLVPILTVSPALASSVSVGFTNTGVTVGGSTIFSADLSGVGLSTIASVKITDASLGVGGASGIFSGFDLDAIFLDVDGNINTTGDQTSASSYSYTAGTVRPDGGNPALQPNAAHPGPLFGSINATTIDFATATLNVLDGVSVADVNSADGFLTLGDGGILIANFVPSVNVGATLFLLAGEVGGNGEDLQASVTISDTPLDTPLPAALPLFASGLGAMGLLGWRRMRKAKLVA